MPFGVRAVSFDQVHLHRMKNVIHVLHLNAEGVEVDRHLINDSLRFYAEGLAVVSEAV